jgi:hypothetical protein
MQVTLPKVIVLLKDTIESKERYLASLKSDIQYYGGARVPDVVSLAAYLETNIEELKRILADLEKIES